LRSFHCLRYLLTAVADVEVVAVVPHRRQPPIRDSQDVRSLAAAHGIPVLAFDQIAGLTYDLGISLLYDRILPASIIARPARGFINAHMAPLPRLRGVNGVLHAIRLARRDNCWSFGVTLHYLDAGIDTGPIIDLIEVPIFADDLAEDLHARASDRIFELFTRNIHRIVASRTRVPATAQTGPAYVFRRKDVQEEIDLSADPDDIYDTIRALSFPGKGRPYARIGRYRIFLSVV
jgi:methionyl-tRNA formyltransferase